MGLDISHEYHLRRGVDHAGPQMAARRRVALLFVGRALASRAARDADDPGAAVPAEFQAWLGAGASGPPPLWATVDELIPVYGG